MVISEEVGKFETKAGISPTLFNANFVDSEEEMSKKQGGGLVLGRLKIWPILQADDLVLVSNVIIGLKGLITRCERYIRRKGVQLNAKKNYDI